MKYLITMVVDSEEQELPMPKKDLEGDEEITDYLNSIAQFAGAFISFDIKKLFNN